MDWLKDAHLEASKAVDLINNKDEPFANAPYTSKSIHFIPVCMTLSFLLNTSNNDSIVAPLI